MILLSCDPGVTGALALFNHGELITIHDMPTYQPYGKRIVDELALREFIKNSQADTLVIEKVHASPRMGVSSAFGFGYSFAIVIGVATGLYLHTETMTPVLWKGLTGLIKQDKTASRKKAIELFPKFKDDFKRVKDTDRAEAALIGYAYLKKIRG